MLQSSPMKSHRPLARTVVFALLIAAFVSQMHVVFVQEALAQNKSEQNESARSVLLSNLKISEQSRARAASPQLSPKALNDVASTSGKKSVTRELPPRNNVVSDPFLGTLAPQTSRPPKASLPQKGSRPPKGAVLQSSGVEEARVTQNATTSGAHEDLDALLWLRTSVEFDALTRQAFSAATEKLGQALVDPDCNALVEAERASSVSASYPPCVIVDVDETMLDNSVFQLERIQSDTEFEIGVWNEFVRRRASPAIKGAADFVKACRASGVKVFFITNREAAVESATRDNLIAEGLMAPSDPDRILSKDEQPGWTSDKSSRRRKVAQTHRVLLLVGDDLNDFLSAKNLTIGQRKQLFQRHQKNWGQTWFVLPNPNYGSWEQTTIGNDYRASRKKKRNLKMQTLGETAQ